MSSKSEGPVFVIAGLSSALTESIENALQETGSTVATLSVASGQIAVRSHAQQSANFATSGYGVRDPSYAGRQVARLLQLLGRIDGLVNVIPTSNNDDDLRTSRIATDPIGRDFYWVLQLSNAVFASWMRSNGGSITNVIGIGEEDEGSRATLAGALVVMLSRELSLEAAPVVDVNAIVVGGLDPALELLLGDPVRRVTADAAATPVQIIASLVVEFQLAERGSHTGEVVIIT